eukprot:TRINITY_DN10929_c0_g1_i1.p1 TRINITY_DN10929_c0_g1~~TRINITY_DN10929_c0_g1_i1.p1  ORF type:complete len:148 (+),score=14.32 TRINITY_DN10929_c0_g1_i1:83-526(+)
MEATLSECSTVDADAAIGFLFTEGSKSNTGPEESTVSRTDVDQEHKCSKCESASGVTSLHGARDASDTWSLGHLGPCHELTPLSRMHTAPSSRAKRAERQRLINEALAHALTFRRTTQKLQVVPMPKPHESIDRDRRSCDRSFKISL